ncbi:MAG: hypothetical protein FI717_07775 [SAR202 cluster bacterium]|nr:hypothetical protein [Chloroflexota bacterium]MQG34188.1 hypothetical protein [SAR202 cluster bacterium]HCP23962.1 hypothetical protein [Dehalococcoidia bacterium]|tara:strand:+ start:5915 stop:6394 length:480 start_codon:yes stop_codon:yes gene_type:complete
MASKRPGETYRGEVLSLPLSQDGQVSVYVWPLRILNIKGIGYGGPTIGVDVGNEEIVRFDCHDTPGHWHRGGYDKLGSPGNSHVDFPDDVDRVNIQVDWALSQIKDNGKAFLEEADHSEAGKLLDPAMVQSAIDRIKAHVDANADLRPQAIAENLVQAT